MSSAPGILRSPASKVLSRRRAVERFGPGRPFRLVFTNGCFDLLHRGHVECLDLARRMGDALLVAVNTDASVRRMGKGPGRPFVDQEARATVIAALESVDGVTLFEEDTPEALVIALLPDVLVKGGDYREREVVGGTVVKEQGGSVVTIPIVAGHSTSALAERVRRGR